MSKSKWSFAGAILLGAVPVLAFAASNAGKITMCHRSGANEYHAISVSENAEGAHRAHGDGAVHEAVPGQPGYSFNDACVPVLGACDDRKDLPNCEAKSPNS